MEKENKIVDEFVKMSKEEAERELKGYKIIIEDLKTGEKQEHISDCILAVFNNKGDKSATQLAITQCPPYITLLCIKAMQNFINKFVDAVNTDNQYFVNKIEEFGARLKAIEEKLGIKPADKPEEKAEDAEGANNE